MPRRDAGSHDAGANDAGVGDEGGIFLSGLVAILARGAAIEARVVFVPLGEAKHVQERPRLWPPGKLGEGFALEGLGLCCSQRTAREHRLQHRHRGGHMAAGAAVDQG